MPTPKPSEETMEEWMDRCVPQVMEDGSAMNEEQATAMCSTMWDDAKSSRPLLKRAYSLLEIKAVDDEKREITGIATTPTADRYGDVVEPKGAEFNLPLPFLWQHDSAQPIGHVTKAKATKDGIDVTVKLVKTDEPGTLKDRLDEAWQSIKLGLVRGLSIGFKSIEHTYIEDTYGIHFLKWDWLELSAVTIPANAEATIQAVKSIDTQQRAASGHTQKRVVKLISPGVSGSTAAKRGAVKLIPRKQT